jgi:hypothetical protein
LKVAFLLFRVTREGGLRLLVLELVENLLVRNVTHLVVLLHQLPVLETHSTLATWYQRITRLIRLADIAVDATPSFTAVTAVPASWSSVAIAVGQGATQWR